MSYYVDFHSESGNFWIHGELEEAMQTADTYAAYNRQTFKRDNYDIEIKDESGQTVATRKWCDESLGSGGEWDQFIDPIDVGRQGFYGDWCFPARKETKVIGVYPICNTGGLLVHDIDYADDRVLVSMNGKDSEWCDIVTVCRLDITPEPELGFYWGEMFVPFSEVMSV